MATTALAWTSTTVNNGATNPDNVQSSDDSRATAMVAGEDIRIALANSPADYNDTNSGNTVTLQVEARTQGSINRAKQVVLTLTNSSGTTITDSGGADITFTTSDLTGSDATYTSSAFTLANNYTAANVDGWELKAAITEGGGMPDSATVEIDLLRVSELQYDVTANNFTQQCDATATGTATLVRKTATIEAATATGTATLVRKTTTTKASTATATASLTKKTATTKAASATGTASLVTGLKFLHTAAATAVGTATLSTLITYRTTLAAAATGTATLVRKVGKIIAATATGTATLVKKTSTSYAATAIGIAALATVSTFKTSLAATATGIAALATQFTAAAAEATISVWYGLVRSGTELIQTLPTLAVQKGRAKKPKGSRKYPKT
jgi:hypothetical protein